MRPSPEPEVTVDRSSFPTSPLFPIKTLSQLQNTSQDRRYPRPGSRISDSGLHRPGLAKTGEEVATWIYACTHWNPGPNRIMRGGQLPACLGWFSPTRREIYTLHGQLSTIFPVFSRNLSFAQPRRLRLHPPQRELSSQQDHKKSPPKTACATTDVMSSKTSGGWR